MDKMTVFYSRATGKIVSVCSGEQDMNMFGDNASDMEIVWNYIITDYNGELFLTHKYYKIDLISKQIIHI